MRSLSLTKWGDVYKPTVSFLFSKILDKHCDIVLVGDSMATAFYGMKNTRSIGLETIIRHSIAVSRGANKSTVVVDMPFNTYRNKACIKIF